MRMACEVCGGREVISLPFIKRSSAPVADMGAIATMKSEYRQFPCPACAPWAEVERVKVMRSHCIVVCHLKDNAEAMAYARHSAAHNLVEGLIENDDFLRITTRPAPVSAALDPDSVQVQVTLGVISKSTVATIEERVAQHQEDLAREVMAEAIKQIGIWGSFCKDETISKDQAVRSVEGALDTVLARRKKGNA
jgi:hypothetical protein